MRDPEYAHLWHMTSLTDLAVFHARYLTHAFARHAHSTFAIGIIVAGTGAYASRGVTHTATAGDVFIIHPDEVHNGFAAGDEGWTYQMIYPAAELFVDLLADDSQCGRGTLFFPQAVVSDMRLHQLLHQFHALLIQPANPLECETYLTWALSHLVTRYAHPVTSGFSLPRHEQRAITQIRMYLEEHIAQKVTLQDLAQLVQMHPSYVIRAFHAAVGLPPHAYLTQIRIDRAQILLRAGRSPSDIAMTLGFADQSHFTRHFRQSVGVTPSQFARSKTF